MKHRGEIVKKAIYESKMPITKLAATMGKDPKTIYNWMETHDLSYEKIMEIGRIIRHDFTEDFQDLKKLPPIAAEPMEVYGKTVDFKEKYYALLAEQNVMLQTKVSNFTALTDAIEKLATAANKSINNLGDELKETLINNNKVLSDSLSAISQAIQHTK